MIGNSYKIVIFLSIVFLLAILVRCDKPQESSSPPAIIKKVMQPVVTNTPVRKELSEEKPETNWFAAIDGTHGRLAGIFREANGNPITNVTATYHKKDRSRYTNTAPQKKKLGFSIEPDGSYLSEPILPGMYSGTFSTPEHSISKADFIIRPEDTTLLEVCFGSYLVITCTVVDAETELPVPDAVVTGRSPFSQPKDASWTSATTPAGTFTVTSRGKLIHLSISHPEYRTEEMGIIYDPKTIYLFRGGDIHLKLLDTQGMLSTNTHTVVLYDSRNPYGQYGHEVARVVCINGTCIFSNVSSGETPMKVIVDQGIGEAFIKKIVPGGVTEITVGLRPKGSLSVDINLPFSNALCRVSVASQKKNITGWLQYNLSHFGRINYQTTVFFQSVLTGSYSVIVNIAKEYRLATNIVINSGKNTELTINEDQFSSGSIKGTFFTTTGKPLDGVVRVYDHYDQSYVRSAPIKTGVFCVTALNKQTAYDIDVMPKGTSIAQTNIIVSAAVPDGPELDIVIPEGYAIRGMIVDKDHVALRAAVSIGNGEWRSYKGGFEQYPVFPGTYKISIQAYKYKTIVKTVTVVDEDIDIGTIVFEDPGITLSGTLLDSQGKPCRKYHAAVLSLFDVPPDKPNVLLPVMADDKGVFSITGVPSDQKLLFCALGNEQSMQKDIGPFYTDTDLGRLSLTPHQYVIVELLDKNGQPVKNVYIDYTRVDNEGIWRGKPMLKGILGVSKRMSPEFENPANVFRTRYTITDEPTNHVTIILPDSFTK